MPVYRGKCFAGLDPYIQLELQEGKYVKVCNPLNHKIWDLELIMDAAIEVADSEKFKQAAELRRRVGVKFGVVGNVRQQQNQVGNFGGGRQTTQNTNGNSKAAIKAQALNMWKPIFLGRLNKGLPFWSLAELW